MFLVRGICPHIFCPSGHAINVGVVPRLLSASDHAVRIVVRTDAVVDRWPRRERSGCCRWGRRAARGGLPWRRGALLLRWLPPTMACAANQA